MDDFFKFEKGYEDFPFYNKSPELSPIDWFILLLGLVLFVLAIEIELIPQSICSILYFLFTFLPLAHVTKGKLEYLFKKPEISDIPLIIKCFFGYFIYGILALILIKAFGGTSTSNAVIELNTDIVFWIIAPIQIMGEELFKAILFLMILFIIFQISKNRRRSVIFSIVVTLIIFGLLHYKAYGGALEQIILVIGLGSGIYTYAYLKTKNITNSFIIHILIDFTALILVGLSGII